MSGNFGQDITDFLLDETETEVCPVEFEVVPLEASGPKCPMMLHLHQEWLEKKMKQERKPPSDENPEVAGIRETEREIYKELSKFENRLAYTSNLPLKKQSVFEDEDVTMSKQLPVLLGKEYFKFQSDSDASSTRTDVTELEERETVLPNKPSKELYLNFSHNNINYSFPFTN
ncbi:uncharacterized protein LOC129798276 isoform X1 [Phlebotomus papatasi]|uniref:uncharacterized protein LOC129798276 isoform X1 n=1 Tax=Phlebotomus papatasi TaxID=29031 RepID=UPI0024833A18|nr:uncharacterized protein LOC129798276 isoform X1 [Phlebotomus papatasi]